MEEKKMDERTEKPKARRRIGLTTKQDIPVEESLLIRQRLRNLCELAIAIGQKQGLLGNHRKDSKKEPEAD
jgi:hypothetical protein